MHVSCPCCKTLNANNGIISGVLVTVGDLSRVGGFAMRQYIPELMPLIVEALLDGAAAMKRKVVVTTLGQVVQSTGRESNGERKREGERGEWRLMFCIRKIGMNMWTCIWCIGL